MNWKNGRALAVVLIGAALLSGCMDEDWWIINHNRGECYAAKKGPAETEGWLEKQGMDVNYNWGGRYDYDFDPWKNGRRRDISYYMLGKEEKASFYKKKDDCEADKTKGYIYWLTP